MIRGLIEKAYLPPEKWWGVASLLLLVVSGVGFWVRGKLDEVEQGMYLPAVPR